MAIVCSFAFHLGQANIILTKTLKKQNERRLWCFKKYNLKSKLNQVWIRTGLFEYVSGFYHLLILHVALRTIHLNKMKLVLTLLASHNAYLKYMYVYVCRS